LSNLNQKRRETLKSLSALGVWTASAGGFALAGCAQTQTPTSAYPAKWSTGTERTKLSMPPDATDCHHHC